MTDRDVLLHRTAELAGDFLDRLPDRPVGPPVDLATLRAAFGGPLPDGPSDPEGVIEALARDAEAGQDEYGRPVAALGRNCVAVDRLAHGDERGHPFRGEAEPLESSQRKADATVEDQDRNRHEEARDHAERAALALVRMDDVDVVASHDLHQPSGGAEVELRLHRELVVGDVVRTASIRPGLAGARRDGDLVAASHQLAGQVPQLNGGAREEVALGINLQDAHASAA